MSSARTTASATRTRSSSTTTATSDATDDAPSPLDSSLDTTETSTASELCPDRAPHCAEWEMPVLLGTDGACGWTCQRNPLYQAPSNNKGPIIGSSLGAMLLVLFVLLGLLVFVHSKKVRRERAAFDKDTEDLAHELSYEPLLLHNTQSVYRRHSIGTASVATQEGLASRLAPFLGLRSGAEQSARIKPTFVNAAPGFGEAGTELTMDIVGRPPEDDPSLTFPVHGKPYRREKAAAVYQVLADISKKSDDSAYVGVTYTQKQHCPSAPPIDDPAALDSVVSDI
ncbi:hypothetical protein H4R19_004423 [Coemansia spiralis]|nr:hypothetical protein H4R19_004423 [Coemansia spiralis]